MACFFLQSLGFSGLDIDLGHRTTGHCTAVGAHDETLCFQIGHVFSDRRFGDVEQFTLNPAPPDARYGANGVRLHFRLLSYGLEISFSRG